MGPFLQVGGDWKIIQDNDHSVSLRIIQNQDQFTASASYSQGQSKKATGTVTDRIFEMTLEWDNGSVGSYLGKLLPPNRIDTHHGSLLGVCVDLSHPDNTAKWWSEGGKVFESK